MHIKKLSQLTMCWNLLIHHPFRINYYISTIFSLPLSHNFGNIFTLNPNPQTQTKTKTLNLEP